ncbi:MAG: CDP-glycerol glycerophosphotransferase family protein [Lachnospiraceae bacterium]|nr:CDP-glycerol glycerophosphotransferase family protein [Lachnospiraceae bacterium]
MKKKLRQYLKMIVQNFILPAFYRLFCIQRIRTGLVVFADGHSVARPERMNRLFEGLNNDQSGKDAEGKAFYEIAEWYHDFQAMSYISALCKMLGFMKIYARANYVVISDNFLPVASCNKRKGTFVIQLWHGCGAFKRFGYDTADDIPEDYVGNVFKNYDIVPVSGDKSVEPFTSAMKLHKGVCIPIGVSATDQYYDKEYKEKCKGDFYRICPEARGKKILLWAPTFRGMAASPVICGEEIFKNAANRLSDEWYVIIKYHPHMEAKGKKSTIELPTERLLPVTDILVTDYSSIIFNYSIFQRPVLLFAPDLDEYSDMRGFYLNYHELPGELVKTEDELFEGICNAEDMFDINEMQRFYEEYMGGCDGNATKRLIDIMSTKRYRS